MKPSQRIRPALEVAQERMRRAALKLADVQYRHEQKQQQLRELECYRNEYMQGLLSKGRAGLNMVQMKDYNVFLERLNRALRQQHLVLEAAKAELEKCMQQWRQEQARVSSLEKVMARKLRVERLEADRREQIECNEHARYRWRRKAT